MKNGILATGLMLALAACQPSVPPQEKMAEKSKEMPKPAAPASYAPAGWTAKSMTQLIAALEAGEVTSAELVKAYLKRIAEIDRSGPTLQSVLTLNPDALADAQAIDARRANGEKIGPLQGIPVLVKDNINVVGKMPTTAGALALKDNYTSHDATFIVSLKENGAIILGKTNLSQWANFRSNNSVSGWTALGGQVRNPHILDRTPCGSSSGSGAAMAASLAAATIGTETNGSIICPSNVNGIVGFKPTVGLVSQEGIIPISSTQDTAGPMTKTVSDAALLLGSMNREEDPLKYINALDAGSLKGKRVGVLRFTLNTNPDLTARFDVAIKVLEAQGAELVEIEAFEAASKTVRDSEWIVLTREFKTLLNEYLATTSENVPVKSLTELIAFNEEHAEQELSVFDQSIFVEADKTEGMDDPKYAAAVKDVTETAGVNGIDAIMKQFEVDVLVSPSGPVAALVDPVKRDVWGSWAGFGYAAAYAGYPHLSVPMGDILGVPVGLSFFGTAGADAEVLSYGYAFEQASHLRREPKYLRTAEDGEKLSKAMKRNYD